MSIWNGKYISLLNIIEKVYRETKNIHDLQLADAVEWAGECLELIRVPLQMFDKQDWLEIKEYRSKLPCDLAILMGVREKVTGVTMRYSTFIYQHSKLCDDKGVNNHNPNTSDLNYTINDDYMFTSFNEGWVQVTYKATPTDENGWPLVPDLQAVIQAVKSYIKERIYLIAWESGKVTQALYQKMESDRLWYIGAAETALKLPSMDYMESIKNNFIRLIPKINHHGDGFKAAGDPEKRYTHTTYGTGSNNDLTSKDLEPAYFYRK